MTTPKERGEKRIEHNKDSKDGLLELGKKLKPNKDYDEEMDKKVKRYLKDGVEY